MNNEEKPVQRLQDFKREMERLKNRTEEEVLSEGWDAINRTAR